MSHHQRYAHFIRRRGDYAALGLLTLTILVFHWRGIRPGYVFLSVDLANNLLPWRGDENLPLQNWLISDPLYQFYPFTIQAVNSLRTGQWLLWNPGILAGHPALADPLFQTFYPVSALLGLLFGPAQGFSLALVAHTLLAALLMYGLLRCLRCQPPASMLGGLTYALGGYMLTWFTFPFWVTTLAWLPGILWAYWAGIVQERWRLFGVAGLLLGLALLAGQFQFVAVFCLFWGAWALACTVVRRPVSKFGPQECAPDEFTVATPGRLRRAYPLLGWLVAFVIGGLIGSVQALNLAELLAVSRRAAGGGLQDALPWSQLVTLLLPNFFGSPTLPQSYWGSGNYNEQTIYFGIVAFFMAWLSLFGSPRVGRWFVAAAVLAVIWMAVGGPGVALLWTLPVLNQVALHRVIFLLPLLMAWLAADGLCHAPWRPRTLAIGLSSFSLMWLALGLGAWNERTAASPQLLWTEVAISATLVLGTALLLLVCNWWPQWRPVATWLIVGLVVVNLFWFGYSYNPVGRKAELFPATPITQYLLDNPEEGRVVPLQRGNTLLFGPNAITDYGVRQPGGYTSLVPAAYHHLISRSDPEIDSPWIERASNFVLFSFPSERLLDLLNVSLLVAPEELFDPGPEAEIVSGDCSGPSLHLSADQPLAGEFMVWHTAINRIDIPFVPGAAIAAPDESAAVRLRLWRDGPEGTLVVDTTGPVTDVLQEPQWTVYFAPEEDAPGRRYAWDLTAVHLRDDLLLCADSSGSLAMSVYGAQLAAVDLPPDNGVRLYRRLAPHPHASVVYSAEVLDDAAMLLDRLLNPAFDARNVALVETALSLPVQPLQPATRAEIIQADNNRVVIDAVAQADGLLVLADQYYPGWQATVDGVPVAILRVNYIMRGVPLAAGRHRVEFVFAPRNLWLGGGLGVLGLALAASLALWERRARFTP